MRSKKKAFVIGTAIAVLAGISTVSTRAYFREYVGRMSLSEVIHRSNSPHSLGVLNPDTYRLLMDLYGEKKTPVISSRPIENSENLTMEEKFFRNRGIYKPFSKDGKQDAESAERAKHAEDTLLGHSVRIYAEPDASSEVVGKLYKDMAGTVLQEENGFYRFISGDVSGWVHKSCVATGEEAVFLSKHMDILTATVNTKELNIRLHPELNAEVLDYVNEGTKLNVAESVYHENEKSDWLPVWYDKETVGYVASRYVNLSISVKPAMTIEEEQEAIQKEKDRIAEEERLRKEAEAKALAEKLRAEEEARRRAEEEALREAQRQQAAREAAERQARAAAEERQRQLRAASQEKIYMGVFRLTFYDPSPESNGGWTHTASGTLPQVGRTIAVNPSQIPYGTKVMINGHVYIAEDCGTGIVDNCIDIFVATKEEAYRKGIQYADVYILR